VRVRRATLAASISSALPVAGSFPSSIRDRESTHLESPVPIDQQTRNGGRHSGRLTAQVDVGLPIRLTRLQLGVGRRLIDPRHGGQKRCFVEIGIGWIDRAGIPGDRVRIDHHLDPPTPLFLAITGTMWIGAANWAAHGAAATTLAADTINSSRPLMVTPPAPTFLFLEV
jgi:hypothetical protein